jgi:hypothetical protein
MPSLTLEENNRCKTKEQSLHNMFQMMPLKDFSGSEEENSETMVVSVLPHTNPAQTEMETG